MPPIDTFSQLPSIQRNLTGLSLQSGEPFAIQRTGQQLASNVAQSVPPYRLFGQALTELLKQYQQIGTAKFTGAELGARQEQARRVLGKTPQELIGASPQLQSQVRGVQAGALEPTISGAGELKRTFTEQLKGLGGAIEQARALIKEGEESENKRRDDARTIIRDALTLAGGSAFQGADPKEVEQLEKMSGYPKGYIQNLSQTIRERELELKRQKSQVDELTLSQRTNTFNRIVDKFSVSPLIAANDRVVILKDVSSQLEKSPLNASLQISFIYSMIQALDTYQSAVREGEIGLIQGTQGIGEQLTNALSKAQRGNPIGKNKVLQYINTARLLVNSINSAALLKQRQFQSQADVAGVGDQFRQYIGGFQTQQAPTKNINRGGRIFEVLPD